MEAKTIPDGAIAVFVIIDHATGMHTKQIMFFTNREALLKTAEECLTADGPTFTFFELFVYRMKGKS